MAFVPDERHTRKVPLRVRPRSRHHDNRNKKADGENPLSLIPFGRRVLLLVAICCRRSAGAGGIASAFSRQSHSEGSHAKHPNLMHWNSSLSRKISRSFLSHSKTFMCKTNVDAAGRNMSRTTTCLESTKNEFNPHDEISKGKKDVMIRVLCLHGKGENGNSFVDTSLRPLRTLIERRLESKNEARYNFSFKWREITAPYEITPGGGGKNGYSWWTMPPGVRSFNAEEVSRTVYATSVTFFTNQIDSCGFLD